MARLTDEQAKKVLAKARKDLVHEVAVGRREDYFITVEHRGNNSYLVFTPKTDSLDYRVEFIDGVANEDSGT